MKGITAEQAREIAIGKESVEVKDAIDKIETIITQRAEKGHLDVNIEMLERTVAVTTQCKNILLERGFVIEQNRCGILSISWGKV